MEDIFVAEGSHTPSAGDTKKYSKPSLQGKTANVSGLKLCIYYKVMIENPEY